jgi:hypothetical protein
MIIIHKTVAFILFSVTLGFGKFMRRLQCREWGERPDPQNFQIQFQFEKHYLLRKVKQQWGWAITLGITFI